MIYQRLELLWDSFHLVRRGQRWILFLLGFREAAMRGPKARLPRRLYARYAHTALRWELKATGLLFPRRAARLAIETFESPRRTAPLPKEEQALAAARPFELLFEGMALRGHVFGRGPVVLFVHGWEGRSGQMAPLARAIADAGFQSVLFDLPAHGRSGGTCVDFAMMSRAICAVASRFCGKNTSPAIVGHSSGCLAAVWALDRGLRSERVVMLATPPSAHYIVSRYTESLRLSGRVEAEVKRLMDERQGRDAGTLNVPSSTRSVRALLCHDERDLLLSIDDARQVAAAWPGAELAVFRGFGHVGLVRSAPVISTVCRFLEAP